METFWDRFERLLAVSVDRDRGEYAVREGQTAEAYAKLTRAKMQAAGMKVCNHSSPTFRRLARELGIPYTRKALIEAADEGGSKSSVGACETCGAGKNDPDHASTTWDVCPVCLRPNRTTPPHDREES